MSNEVLVSLADQVRPEHTALVVVDVQNDFVHPDGWVMRRGVREFQDAATIPAAMEAMGALLSAARAHDLVTVLVRMIGDVRYLSPAMQAQFRRLHGEAHPPCVIDGTWGAELHDDFHPEPRGREWVLDKQKYSAFAGTRLDTVLRMHGVKTVVVCGVATSGCVESTARDALFADYYVVTAGDGCADYDPDRHRASLRKLDLSFGYVVPAVDVVACWDAASGPAGVPAASGAVAPA